MHLSWINQLFNPGELKMLECVRKNDEEGLVKCLDLGANVEFKPFPRKHVAYSGDNALNLACKLGHLECVQALISRGARVDAVGENGKTPLHEWYRQAERVIQRLGVGKVGHTVLHEEFKRVGWVLLSAGATLGEHEKDRCHLIDGNPVLSALEYFMKETSQSFVVR